MSDLAVDIHELSFSYEQIPVLEHVSLGNRLQAKAAWMHVILRTALYSLGVFVVLVLEKGFEGRHEYGGFAQAISAMWKQEDVYHLWANAIVVTGALFVYNMLSVVRGYLGEGGLLRLFLTPRH